MPTTRLMPSTRPMQAWPSLAALGSLLSVQFGAAVAKQLFGQVGPQGVVASRLGLGAVMLTLLTRP